MNAFSIVFSDVNKNHQLGELAECRTIAAIPFGGRYRLIDFIMSSLVKAKVHDVGVVTTSKYASLIEHLGWGSDWDLNRKNGGLKILTPFATETGNKPINNRFDLLHSVSGYIDHRLQEYCVLADGNILINIDLEYMLKKHIEKQADITAVYRTAPPIQGELSVIVDGDGRITDGVIHPGDQANPQNVAINLFIMSKHVLSQLISKGMTMGWESITRDMIAKNIDGMSIYGYKHEGYCNVINTLEQYFTANMQLLQPRIRNMVFGSDTRILTRVMDTVPSKYGENNRTKNSFIADGCTIDGDVENCIIFRDVKIAEGAVVKNSIIMQGSLIDKAYINCSVVDKNVIVSAGQHLSGSERAPYVIKKDRAV